MAQKAKKGAAKRAAPKKKSPAKKGTAKKGVAKKLAQKLRTVKAAVKKKKAPAKKAMPKKSPGARGTAHRGARSPGYASGGKRAPGNRVSARLSGASVDDYITSVPAPFRAVLAELRQVVMTAAPEATCSIKWGQPVFECNGPFAWMKAFSSHASLGFFRGSELPDPDGLLKGTGNKMRHVKITEPEHIPVAKLDALVRAAVALNKEKGAPSSMSVR